MEKRNHQVNFQPYLKITTSSAKSHKFRHLECKGIKVNKHSAGKSLTNLPEGNSNNTNMDQ